MIIFFVIYYITDVRRDFMSMSKYILYSYVYIKIITSKKKFKNFAIFFKKLFVHYLIIFCHMSMSKDILYIYLYNNNNIFLRKYTIVI